MRLYIVGRNLRHRRRFWWTGVGNGLVSQSLWGSMIGGLTWAGVKLVMEAEGIRKSTMLTRLPVSEAAADG